MVELEGILGTRCARRLSGALGRALRYVDKALRSRRLNEEYKALVYGF
jgi:hypothetical protein